jgi:hypothetical protein
MNLALDIYHYYLNNQHLLGQDKLFHFATRTAAWNGDSEAYEILRKLHDYIVPSDLSLEMVLQNILSTPQTGRRNAHELRQPFFDRYPKLYGAHLALFRVRHLKSVYGIDAKQALFNVISEQELVQLKNDLFQDKEALLYLSTFAINFCYLLDRVIRNDEESLDVASLYEAGKLYDLSNKTHIQLFIYLYTHCIIGESNFYTREIPADTLPIYQKMLSDLEAVISDNFDNINLDNKLEFLVCARICNYMSNLYERINSECAKSLSADGIFLIDIHNSNAQADRNDFVRSEHRNVLFIMSTSAYTPHATLV